MVPRFPRRAFALAAAAILASPALARDALGTYGTWAAFRDAAHEASPARCYAIAMPTHGTGGRRDFTPYADVGDWPARNLRGAVHFRLPRAAAPGAKVALSVGGARFMLISAGADAWAANAAMDAAVVGAMRGGGGMTLTAHDAAGHGFSETWELAGAATAIDSALVGCAGVR